MYKIQQIAIIAHLNFGRNNYDGNEVILNFEFQLHKKHILARKIQNCTS